MREVSTRGGTRIFLDLSHRSPPRARAVADEIWVSTDHDEIARIAREGGARVHRRSAAVSTDEASSDDTVLEFIRAKNPQCDVIIHAQATSPCISPPHYREMMDKFFRDGYDSLFTVSRQHMFRWEEVDDDGKNSRCGSSSTAPLNFDPKHRPRRQDWRGELYENGAVYVSRVDAIKTSGYRQSGRVGYYEMPLYLFVDIDEPSDWFLAEKRVQQYGYTPNHNSE